MNSATASRLPQPDQPLNSSAFHTDGRAARIVRGDADDDRVSPSTPADADHCPVPYLPGEEDFVTEQLDFGWVYDLNPLATFRMVTRLERLTEEAGHLDHKQHSILELREREGLFRYVVQRQFDPTATARGPRFFGSKPAMLKLTQIWQPSNWDGTRKYDTV